MVKKAKNKHRFLQKGSQQGATFVIQYIDKYMKHILTRPKIAVQLIEFPRNLLNLSCLTIPNYLDINI